MDVGVLVIETTRIVGTQGHQYYQYTSDPLNLSPYAAVLSLECYVCDNQDGNTEKCTKTIKTCEFEEDRCLSTIVWSTTPYWTQGAEKQYYVSKRCADEAQCDLEIKKSMELCHYIWSVEMYTHSIA